MLSFVKKYVMKKIGYESSSKPINIIEDIKIDFKLVDELIKIKDIKIDFKLVDELTKIKDIKIDFKDIKIDYDESSLKLMNIIKPCVENRRTGYGPYSQLINPDYHSDFLKDIRNVNKVDNINMNYKPAKEGPLLGTMDLRQQENFQKSLENVILFRINEFRSSYYSDRAVVRNISTQVESITRGSRDLVLLLLLIYPNKSVDNNIELSKDLIKNYSGSRVKMIEKMHLLGEQGELSIKSSKCLDCIIKMSTFIEKQCRSNIVSVMNMVSSGKVDGLVQDVEARVKNLIGIDIGYDKHSPASGLKDLSIDTLVKHGLIK